MDNTTLGQLAIIIAQILGFATLIVRENYKRKWMINEIIEKAKAEAEAVKIAAEARIEVLKIENEASELRIIKRNSEFAAEIKEDQRKSFEEIRIVASEALHEANDTNKKIEDLNKRLLAKEQ